ncbi:MAG TPA: hypothetical protein PKW80_15520 [Bacteroidales bacterium]|nr:hypothetical protein [Bacteroidales bacterium]
MGKVEDIQKLIDTFKLERIIYVVLTGISAISLIGIGLFLALAKSEYYSFLALLVPTGTLTLCIFRVLKMWDDALKFIGNQNQKEEENEK